LAAENNTGKEPMFTKIISVQIEECVTYGACSTHEREEKLML